MEFRSDIYNHIVLQLIKEVKMQLEYMLKYYFTQTVGKNKTKLLF